MLKHFIKDFTYVSIYTCLEPTSETSLFLGAINIKCRVVDDEFNKSTLKFHTFVGNECLCLCMYIYLFILFSHICIYEHICMVMVMYLLPYALHVK